MSLYGIPVPVLKVSEVNSGREMMVLRSDRKLRHPEVSHGIYYQMPLLHPVAAPLPPSSACSVSQVLLPPICLRGSILNSSAAKLIRVAIIFSNPYLRRSQPLVRFSAWKSWDKKLTTTLLLSGNTKSSFKTSVDRLV